MQFISVLITAIFYYPSEICKDNGFTKFHCIDFAENSSKLQKFSDGCQRFPSKPQGVLIICEQKRLIRQILKTCVMSLVFSYIFGQLFITFFVHLRI